MVIYMQQCVNEYEKLADVKISYVWLVCTISYITFAPKFSS